MLHQILARRKGRKVTHHHQPARLEKIVEMIVERLTDAVIQVIVQAGTIDQVIFWLRGGGLAVGTKQIVNRVFDKLDIRGAVVKALDVIHLLRGVIQCLGIEIQQVKLRHVGQ